jgi:hypothetical protein
MIELTHYDDGKKNFQSHEISIKEKCFYNAEYDVTSHNIFSLIGYGETKEEALEDYKKKFGYVMDELRVFERMLFETDVLENSMVEVDAGGNEIK